MNLHCNKGNENWMNQSQVVGQSKSSTMTGRPQSKFFEEVLDEETRKNDCQRRPKISNTSGFYNMSANLELFETKKLMK